MTIFSRAFLQASMAASIAAGILTTFTVPAAAATDAGSNQTTGVTKTDVTLGSCAALTGQVSPRGQHVVAGGKAYFSYINDNGGVHGRKIVLTSNDDKYSAEGADACFYSCLKDKVFAGVLFQGTPTAARYVPKSDTGHLPMVGFSTGADFIINPLHPFVFQVRASYRDEAREQIESIVNKLHEKKISIVYQDDAYGAACRTAVLEAMAKFDLHPISEIPLPRLTHDIEKCVRQLKTEKPGVLIPAVTGDALPLLVKRRKEISDNLKIVCFSPATELLVKEAGNDADGVLITETVPFLLKDTATGKLHQKLIEKYAAMQPTAGTFEGFLIGMVVVEGLKRAGHELTRDSFVKALESMHDFDLGLGQTYKLTYSAKRHDGLRGNVTWVTLKNGKPTSVADVAAVK